MVAVFPLAYFFLLAATLIKALPVYEKRGAGPIHPSILSSTSPEIAYPPSTGLVHQPHGSRNSGPHSLGASRAHTLSNRRFRRATPLGGYWVLHPLGDQSFHVGKPPRVDSDATVTYNGAIYRAWRSVRPFPEVKTILDPPPTPEYPWRPPQDEDPPHPHDVNSGVHYVVHPLGDVSVHPGQPGVPRDGKIIWADGTVRNAWTSSQHIGQPPNYLLKPTPKPNYPTPQLGAHPSQFTSQ